ncbi:MAG TPA: hypothetical protein VHA74_01220, partial [Candidatus Dojkabacteria bacterium]|nr:hypothetical protein [Candidatus Dojkabacteria bacterium]
KIPILLRKIRSLGVITVIASNNMDCFTRWTVDGMKLNTLFDEIINSFDVKGLKHEVRNDGSSIFFTDILAKYKILPKECAFFDDGVDKEDYISKLGIEYIRLVPENDLTKCLEDLLLTVDES